MIIQIRDNTAPASEKPFHEIAGTVVGVVSPKVARGNSKSVVVYIDGVDRVAKITLSRTDVEVIVAALPPAGAHNAPAAYHSRKATTRAAGH